jgi:hypothetical protein
MRLLSGFSVTIALILACTAFSTSRLEASASVFPKFLFLNYPGKSVAMTVANATGVRQEIWIDFRYGYPLVNDTGKFYIHYIDSTLVPEPNMLRWLSVYPQRFALDPGESQVVRVLVQPSIELSNGEYWARVVVNSKERAIATPQIPGANPSTRIDIISQMDVPLHFRKGDVSASVQIRGITSLIDSGKLKMGVDISRIGNASFWGTMQITLRDDRGRSVETRNLNLALYHDFVYPVTLNVVNIAPGQYMVEVQVRANRSEVPRQFQLKANVTRFTYQVSIP